MKHKIKKMTVFLCISFLILSVLTPVSQSISISKSERAIDTGDSIENAGQFSIEKLRPSESEIIEGDEIKINYTVTNTGSEKGTQDIELEIYEPPLDRGDIAYQDREENVEINAGDSYQGTFTWQTDTGDYGDYRVELSTQDETKERHITVWEAGIFAVSSRPSDRDIIQGDGVKISYSVINTKDVEDTQEVKFSVYFEDDKLVHQDNVQEVTLSPEESHEGEFNWQTNESIDPGWYRLKVNTDEGEKQSWVQVLKTDIFAVDIALRQNEFVEGEKIEFNYTVMNTGEQKDTQNINFTVYEITEDREKVSIYQDVDEDVSIESRGTYEDSFAWQSNEGDTGRFSLKVNSEDDEYERRITVWRADIFAVKTRLQEHEITKGDDVVVEYTVKNTGEQKDTQNINLLVKDGQENVIDQKVDKNVSIGPGETYKSKFVWKTNDVDSGEYTLVVSSEEDKTEDGVKVWEPDIFAVENKLRDRKIKEGDEVTVNFTVTNTGQKDTQDIEFKVYDLANDKEVVHEEVKKDITIERGETYEGDFVWKTEKGDSGEYSIEIASEDDKAGRHLTVSKGEAFVIDLDLRKNFVIKGDEVSVDYSVENTKDGKDTQDIEFTVDYQNEPVHEDIKKDLTLEAGENYEGQFMFETQGLDTGGHEINISSEDDTATWYLDIKEDDIFSVEMDIHNNNVSRGDEVLVKYTVMNTGQEEKTQDIEFSVHDAKEEVVHQEVENDVTIESGETYEGEFTWKIPDGESSRYNFIVSSDDDEESYTLGMDGEGTGSEEAPMIPGFTILSLIIGISVIVGYEFTRKIHTGS